MEEICVDSLSVVLLSLVSYGAVKHVTCLLFVMETDPHTSNGCVLIHFFFAFSCATLNLCLLHCVEPTCGMALI